MGPSVSVLTGFDGMCFILSTALLICDEISCGICQQWMSFCEILPLYYLISESLLQFYLYLLIFNIVSFFRRKMQRGKYCLTRSVRKLN